MLSVVIVAATAAFQMGGIEIAGQGLFASVKIQHRDC